MSKAGRWRSAVARVQWSVADQALSSLTNFALRIVVLRETGLRGFGAFSIAFLVYTAALGVSRAMNSQPLMVRFASSEEPEWRRAAKAATGTALVFGVLIGLVGLALSLVLSGTISSNVAAVSLVMPALLLQDAWRFVFSTWRRGRSAFLNDLVWVVAIVPGFAYLTTAGEASSAGYVLAWGIAAAIAAVAGAAQAALLPSPTRVVRWVRAQGDLGSRFTGEFAAMAAGNQLSVYGIAAVAGLEALGAIQAAQLVFGPLNLLSLGLGLVAIPEAVRALERSKRALRRILSVLGGGLATAILLFGAAAYVVPMEWGRALFDDPWTAARALLIPIAIFKAMSALSWSSVVGLRALEAARRSFWVRLGTTPVAIGLAVAGAAVAGAEGGAWGLAIGSIVIAGAFRWHLARALSEVAPTSSAGSDAVSVPD